MLNEQAALSVRKEYIMICTLMTVLIANGGTEAMAVTAADFRPPAVPLVACDPYFSIWSFSNKLTDEWPRHWTGTVHALSSMVRIDGKPFRLMGPDPKSVPAMTQVSLKVLPTQTIYTFQADGVSVTLRFTTPTLPDSIEVLSRPVTYLTWQARSTDGKDHAVSVYYDNSAELVVNTPNQPVTWSRPNVEGLSVLQMGSKDQPILAKKGDNLRIDWGYLYVAAPKSQSVQSVVAGHDATRSGFSSTGSLPTQDDTRMPRPAKDDWPVAAFGFDLGKVTSQVASCHLILAYDELYSIELMGKRLRPYWRRNGAEAADLLKVAAAEYTALENRCAAFDDTLTKDMTRIGGTLYAQLAALAYRQAFAANTIAASSDGKPLMFPKENFSNGCISTVDVIYPEAPILLLFNTELLRGSLTPLMDYAASGRWKFPFAPHDLGTYPLANGQVYGGGEKTETDQMPVEESGNMILLLAALAKIEGNADYAAKYFPQITRWAEYLKKAGLDPANQLCTDDFAGHLAHNVNLSAKAIVALGAYAQLCDRIGKKDEAASYRKLAEDFAAQWVKMADDGDHYRLAFDKPGTWSQKYNLVWDRLLDLKLFPAEVIRKEIAYYKKVQKKYGLPLDNRKSYTKIDWILWTATLAETQEDFEALVAPAYAFAQESPSRVPLSDWYHTTNAKQVGFQARSVVGGLFIKMLSDDATWKKWAGQAGK